MKAESGKWKMENREVNCVAGVDFVLVRFPFSLFRFPLVGCLSD
jgi:hypothetical protein